jgi:hypothetical protein
MISLKILAHFHDVKVGSNAPYQIVCKIRSSSFHQKCSGGPHGLRFFGTGDFAFAI